jgi:hypothetical protein
MSRKHKIVSLHAKIGPGVKALPPPPPKPSRKKVVSDDEDEDEFEEDAFGNKRKKLKGLALLMQED